MATGQRDIIARLADAGEEAIQRLAGTPGADRVLGVVTNMRDQLDFLSKRVRGMDALERRIDALEREVEKLQGRRTTARGASSSRTVVNKKVSPARKTTSTSQKKTSTSRSTKKRSS